MGATVETPLVCDRCGAGAMVHRQSLHDGRLVYSASFRCSCGRALEIDGDVPPPPVRELMLEKLGVWRLSLSEPTPKARPEIARVLSRRLDLNLQKALELVRDSPAALATGTRIEIWAATSKPVG